MTLTVPRARRRPGGRGRSLAPWPSQRPRRCPAAETGLIGLAERVARRRHARARRRPRRRVRPACEACTMIRVLLVDDDALVRSGLRIMLAGAANLDVVGEARRPRGARRGVDLHRPHVVLMDSPQPELATRCHHLLAAQPDPPAVLVLTTFDADELVLRARRPASRWLPGRDTRRRRSSARCQLVHAGDDLLLDGHTPARSPWWPAALPRAEQPATGGDVGPTRAGCRPRRRPAGDANAEIAAALHLFVATVKAHRLRLFEKSTFDNRVADRLSVQAGEHGEPADSSTCAPLGRCPLMRNWAPAQGRRISEVASKPRARRGCAGSRGCPATASSRRERHSTFSVGGPSTTVNELPSRRGSGLGRAVDDEPEARTAAELTRRTASRPRRPRPGSTGGRWSRRGAAARGGPPRRCCRRGRAGTIRSSPGSTAAAGRAGRRRGSPPPCRPPELVHVLARGRGEAMCSARRRWSSPGRAKSSSATQRSRPDGPRPARSTVS